MVANTLVKDATYANAPGAPRGIRNNNPGNIEFTSIKWRGLVGSDGRYAVFDTPVNGLRAMALEIWDSITRDGDNTIRTLINQWAPPTENLTGAYAVSVSKQTDIGVDEVLVYRRDVGGIMRAITKHENGVQPYPDSVFTAAIQAAGK